MVEDSTDRQSHNNTRVKKKVASEADGLSDINGRCYGSINCRGISAYEQQRRHSKYQTILRPTILKYIIFVIVLLFRLKGEEK